MFDFKGEGAHAEVSESRCHRGDACEIQTGELQRDLRKFGIHGKVILESDHENAIVDAQQALS